jgi:hypothetical protein
MQSKMVSSNNPAGHPGLWPNTTRLRERMGQCPLRVCSAIRLATSMAQPPTAVTSAVPLFIFLGAERFSKWQRTETKPFFTPSSTALTGLTLRLYYEISQAIFTAPPAHVSTSVTVMERFSN